MRTPSSLRWKRLFATVAGLHFSLSLALLVLSIGGAVDAQEGGAAAVDQVISKLTDLLTAPIVLARVLLPESVAPGFSFLALLLNSLIWAALATLAARTWRTYRER